MRSLVLAVVVSAWACAPADGDEPARRVVLTATTWPAQHARDVPLGDPRTSDAWTVEVGRWSDDGALLPAGEPPRSTLRLDRWSSGDDPPSHLRLMLASPEPAQVSVQLLRRGRSLSSLPPVLVPQGSSASEVRVPWPSRLSQLRDIDALRVVVAGAGALAVGPAARVSVPASAVLPSESELVRIAGEARRAQGLLPDVARHWELPAGPGRLTFAVGQPEAVRRAGRSASVSLRSADGDELTRVTLDDPLQRDARWTAVEVDLPTDEPGPLSLHFDGPADSGCAVADAAWCPHDAPARAQPDVLLITSDTHRGDHLGAVGSGVPVRTPRLDALAARGVVFTDAFSTTNFTNPSHAALMTGVHPRDTGVLSNNRPLSDAAPTLAEAFADAGWRTWAVLSARHLGHEISGLGQGFDRMTWPDDAQRAAPPTLAALDRWLAAEDDDPRPLFVWVHLFDAHQPYVPPAGFAEPWDGDPFDEALPAPGADVDLPPSLRGLRDLEWARAQYRGEVAYLDDQLGAVLEHPRLARGLLALAGDHGESLGAHGIWFSHAGLYPDTLHVPLLLAGPGVPSGERRAQPVRQLDLGRTLLDLARLDDVAFPGRSLLAPPRTEPRFALASHGTSASVTHDDWHLVLHLHDHHRQWTRHQVELFDLANDPASAHDLVDVEPERAAALRGRIIDWLAAARPSGWAGRQLQDAELTRQLTELGYAQGGGSTDTLFVSDGCAWCARFE